MEIVGVLKLMVNDLVVIGGKGVPVFLDVERLVKTCKGSGALDNDKVVDKVVGGIEANFQPVELGVDGEKVVDLPLGAASAVLQGGGAIKDVQAMLSTKGLGELRL